MHILERLFGNKKASSAPCDDELDRLVERVVELNPPLLHARDHEARLRSAVAKSVDYLRGLVADLPPPRAVNVQAWTTDPYIRAFFAAAGDIPNALSRSADLRTFLDASPGVDEGYAVLGMELTERRTLGVSQEGGMTRSDVPQTTLSFGDHQLRICGSTVEALRAEIVGRMVEQLAIEALAQIAEEGKQRDMLERERALLVTRLKILERQGAGMRSVTGEGTQPDAGELARLRAQMDENNVGLRNLGLLSQAIDRQLDCFCEFFSDPGKRIHIITKRVRLSRMNVVVAEGASEEAHTLDLAIARVPGDPPRERSFALVHVARADVPKPVNLLDEAARLLG